MDKNIDVLCVGSTTIDVFLMLGDQKDFNYDKFSNKLTFSLGSKIPLDQYTFSLGGNACNTSVGLSRLGFKTSLAAEVGSDEMSQKVPNTLSEEGVDLTYLKKEKTKDPYFNVILSYQGERTIIEEKNPLGIDLEVGTMHSKLVFLASVRGNWQKAYERVFSECRDEKFAFNPGTRQLLETKHDVIKILPKIDYLFVNLQEAQILADDEDLDIKKLMGKIKDFGVGTVIITDGINGSYANDKNNDIYQTGVCSTEKAVERTGAGDAYASGFLYACLSDYPVKDALRYGAINAESVIRKIGSQEGLLTKNEIEEKAKENQDLVAVKI